MQIRLFTLFALLLVCVLPSLAQDTNVLSYGDYSFTYPSSMGPHISIKIYAGDPLDEEPPSSMMGWEAPHTQFELFNAQDWRPQFIMRFTRMDELEGYPEEEGTVAQISDLLENRPDLKVYEAGDFAGVDHDLPVIPGGGAVQILIARAEYVETENFAGIGYLTVYVQNDVPLTGDSFRYVFFGISKDNATYVWMETFLNTDLLPTSQNVEFDEASQVFYTDREAYLEQTIETLNVAPADDFTPSLDDIASVLDSIQVTSDQ